jgi:hypothetical protein
MRPTRPTRKENAMHPMSTNQVPMNYDDLIDLHYLLQTDELFLQLLAGDVKGREAA